MGNPENTWSAGFHMGDDSSVQDEVASVGSGTS